MNPIFAIPLGTPRMFVANIKVLEGKVRRPNEASRPDARISKVRR